MTIVLTGLCKSYGSLPVLKDLSATLSGHTVLWGPSGCGKTTLARILWGLEVPDAGHVTFCWTGPQGEALYLTESAPAAGSPPYPVRRAAHGAHPRLVGVFQEDLLCGQLTAIGNVALVCPRGTKEETIRAAFARLGMSGEALATPAALLSGGQRRRTALVRAALAEAGGAVLDEPFRGLDAGARAAAMEYIKEAFAGRFLLLATHDETEAEFFGPQRLSLPLLAGPREKAGPDKPA